MAWIKGLQELLSKVVTKKTAKATTKEAKAVVKAPKIAKASEVAKITKKGAKTTEEIRVLRRATGEVPGEIPKGIRAVSKSAKANIGAITGATVGAGAGIVIGSMLASPETSPETTEEERKEKKEEDRKEEKIDIKEEEGKTGGIIEQAEKKAQEFLSSLSGLPILGDVADYAISKKQALPTLILLIGGIAVGGYAIYKFAKPKPTKARHRTTLKIVKPVVVPA